MSPLVFLVESFQDDYLGMGFSKNVMRKKFPTQNLRWVLELERLESFIQ